MVPLKIILHLIARNRCSIAPELRLLVLWGLLSNLRNAIVHCSDDNARVLEIGQDVLLSSIELVWLNQATDLILVSWVSCVILLSIRQFEISFSHFFFLILHMGVILVYLLAGYWMFNHGTGFGRHIVYSNVAKMEVRAGYVSLKVFVLFHFALDCIFFDVVEMTCLHSLSVERKELLLTLWSLV